MTFPRMTTRRWMIAVAVVGAIIGGSLELQRCAQRRHYKQLAKNCEHLRALEEAAAADYLESAQRAKSEGREMAAEEESESAEGASKRASLWREWRDFYRRGGDGEEPAPPGNYPSRIGSSVPSNPRP